MPQDTSTFQYSFLGTDIPLQCVLEAGHYSEPSSYHHAFFPNDDFIVVWDDEGNRIQWDDAVASIGSAFEVGIDPSFIPDIADVWASVPSLGDLDNMGEVAMIVNELYNSLGALSERVASLEPESDWTYVGSGGSAPAFENSYVNVPGGSKTSFRKANDYEVELVINTRNGTPNTAIFTLPEAYRPSNAQAALGLMTDNYSSFTVCLLYIGSNGQVKTLFPTGLTYVMGPGIRFRLDSPAPAT